MTGKQAQIPDLFHTLAPDEQREVVESLSAATLHEPRFGRLTNDERLKLDDGIAQAQRGDVVPAEAVFDRLAIRFSFSA